MVMLPVTVRCSYRHFLPMNPAQQSMSSGEQKPRKPSLTARRLRRLVFCSAPAGSHAFLCQMQETGQRLSSRLLEGVRAGISLVLPLFPFSGETEAQQIEGPCSVFPSWSQDSLGEKGPARYSLGSCLLLISSFSLIDVADLFSPRVACGKSFLALGWGAWSRIVAGLWGWTGLDPAQLCHSLPMGCCSDPSHL